MNDHALAVLEFEGALDRVARRAASPIGREAVLALRPVLDAGRVRAELDRVAETMAFLEERPASAPPAVPDARGALRALEVEGGVLTGEELLVTLRLLVASRELAGQLREPRDLLPDFGDEGDSEDTAARAGSFARRPHLASLRKRLVERPEDEAWLGGIVDDEGGIRDGASPELRRIRRRLRSARGEVLGKVERFLESLPERIRVEGASVSVRDGRFVVPIRREGRSEVGGVIHGESATGATLFVEPPIAIELMNQVHELDREEEREVQAILRSAAGRLRPMREALTDALGALVAFDTLQARARSARAWGGHPPEILDSSDGDLVVVNGRHPLLLERGAPVVPFSIELGPQERVVVVSGPNTGGKTVFLKAMGLVHLLTQSGVVPPVGKGTRLAVVDEVFADIGDEQSITESLSTFSAHLANVREILERAGPGTLVLMDELGTGTDPFEGAALARAILEVLAARGARAVVSSHLGALKRLDTEGSGIVNASLLFDSVRIEPTYELRKGRPGRSYGLAIARRLGLSAEVVDLAESYVDPGELRLEAVLASMEQKERELQSHLVEAEARSRRAESLRAKTEAREARVEERERTAESRAREQARRLLLEAREEVEAAIREVREAREGAETIARRKVEEAARTQRERAPRSERRGRGRSVAPVAEGDPVTVVGSGARGVVRELRDDRVTVEVGSVRLQLSRTDIEPAGQIGESRGGADRSARTARRSAAAVSGGGPLGVDARTETDLRGLRVDEVDLAMGRALDDAVVASLPELRIIHGKGTGAVRARVQELLRSDSRVREFRQGSPAEGGAGVTIAVLDR